MLKGVEAKKSQAGYVLAWSVNPKDTTGLAEAVQKCLIPAAARLLNAQKF